MQGMFGAWKHIDNFCSYTLLPCPRQVGHPHLKPDPPVLLSGQLTLGCLQG